MKELKIGTLLKSTMNDCVCRISNIWVDMSLGLGTVWIELTIVKGDTEKFKPVSDMKLDDIIKHITLGIITVEEA